MTTIQELQLFDLDTIIQKWNDVRKDRLIKQRIESEIERVIQSIEQPLINAKKQEKQREIREEKEKERKELRQQGDINREIYSIIKSIDRTFPKAIKTKKKRPSLFSNSTVKTKSS